MTVSNCHEGRDKKAAGSGVSGHGTHVAAAVTRGGFTGLQEANEREVAERRHRAAFHQADTVGSRGPARVALEREFTAPAKLACRRLEPFLESAPQPGFGPNPTHQDDLAARFEDPRELVQRGFGTRYRGDDVLRDHHV